MGQQQVLLLLLSTVVVGLAIVAGLTAFEESQKQSAIDQMTRQALEIAIDVQTYTKRPPRMRVGNSTAEDGEGELVVGFSELPKYETVEDGRGGDDYFTDLARYSLNGFNSLPDKYNQDACPENDPVNTVNAYSRRHDVCVCVGIAGRSEEDLETGVAE